MNAYVDRESYYDRELDELHAHEAKEAAMAGQPNTNYDIAADALDGRLEYDAAPCERDREVAEAQAYATLALCDEVRRLADALASQ
jgi:hypothetical protein